MFAERITPEYFSGRMNQIEQPTPPKTVITHTASLIVGYFNGLSTSPDEISGYLYNNTTHYLQNVMGGLKIIDMLASKTARRYIEPVVNELTNCLFGEDEKKIRQQLEAFNTARVIYSHLPDRYDSIYFPAGFSRRGILEAPKTVKSFRTRTTELYLTLEDIRHGIINKNMNVDVRTRLMRTYAFFKVGAELPFHEGLTKKDIQEMMEESSHNQ